jgi:hypothetical protein
VSQNATELPTMKRVTPNDSGNSYVVHKVEGTQSGFGAACVAPPASCSAQMPLAASALPSLHIQRIKDWINAGAPPP